MSLAYRPGDDEPGPPRRPTTIAWDDDAVLLLDQTRLPHEELNLRITDVADLREAIASLRVRGAMALGVAGALGVALAVVDAQRNRLAGAELEQAVRREADALRATRPTAVNLGWGIAKALDALPDGPDAVVAVAVRMLDEDVAANRRMAEHGADLVAEEARRLGRPLRFLTHCNAGALAAVDYGSALGVIRVAHERGLVEEVLVCETRPLLQGARLTAWELGVMGIPIRLIVDSAGPSLIAGGRVDAVIVGADRVAANGDVANKIGTYGHALAAARAGIPFLVAAPVSTVDSTVATGRDIPIEERAEDEVLAWNGRSVAPLGTRALNPAFDVTPVDLVSALVTDEGVFRGAPLLRG